MVQVTFFDWIELPESDFLIEVEIFDEHVPLVYADTVYRIWFEDQDIVSVKFDDHRYMIVITASERPLQNCPCVVRFEQKDVSSLGKLIELILGKRVLGIVERPH